MTELFRTMEEVWENVEDDTVPELSRYEVSSLGRVRTPAGKVIRPIRRSVAQGAPRVRLFANRRRYVRSVRGLVARVFGPSHAEFAVLAQTGGVDQLMTMRDTLKDQLEEIDQVIGMLAFHGHDIPVGDRSDRSPRRFALDEAAELGIALRLYPDADPRTGMSRREKVRRLARLRASFGAEIEQVSRVTAADLVTLSGACTAP